MDYSNYVCCWTGLQCIACNPGACEFRRVLKAKVLAEC